MKNEEIEKSDKLKASLSKLSLDWLAEDKRNYIFRDSPVNEHFKQGLDADIVLAYNIKEGDLGGILVQIPKAFAQYGTLALPLGAALLDISWINGYGNWNDVPNIKLDSVLTHHHPQTTLNGKSKHCLVHFGCNDLNAFEKLHATGIHKVSCHVAGYVFNNINSSSADVSKLSKNNFEEIRKQSTPEEMNKYFGSYIKEFLGNTKHIRSWLKGAYSKSQGPSLVVPKLYNALRFEEIFYGNSKSDNPELEELISIWEELPTENSPSYLKSQVNFVNERLKSRRDVPVFENNRKTE